MTWVRLDDNMPTHPKVLAVGHEAAYLHICGICYCARLLTDGHVPKAAVPLLGGPAKALPKLLAAGLWTEGDDGYEIVGYLDWNPTRDRVQTERDRNAERQSRYRRRNGVSNAVTDTVSNGVSNGAPSHPIPSHPISSSLQGHSRSQALAAAAAEEVSIRRGLPSASKAKERPQRWLAAAVLGITRDVQAHPEFGRLVHENATPAQVADLLEPTVTPTIVAPYERPIRDSA